MAAEAVRPASEPLALLYRISCPGARPSRHSRGIVSEVRRSSHTRGLRGAKQSGGRDSKNLFNRSPVGAGDDAGGRAKKNQAWRGHLWCPTDEVTRREQKKKPQSISRSGLPKSRGGLLSHLVGQYHRR